MQLLISPKEVTHLSSCYKYQIPNTLDLTSRYKECWAMSLKFNNLLPNLPFWDLLRLRWLSVNSKRISCRYLLIFSWSNTNISKHYCKLKSSNTKFLCTKTFLKTHLQGNKEQWVKTLILEPVRLAIILCDLGQVFNFVLGCKREIMVLTSHGGVERMKQINISK